MIAALLSGCAHEALRAVEPKMAGMSIDDVIALLGPPGAETEIAGRKYITWTNDTKMTMYTPQTTNSHTYGNVGNAPVNANTSTTTTKATTNSYHCKFTVAVDDDYQVVSASHEGNQHACRRFASRLKPLKN